MDECKKPLAPHADTAHHIIKRTPDASSYTLTRLSLYPTHFGSFYIELHGIPLTWRVVSARLLCAFVYNVPSYGGDDDGGAGSSMVGRCRLTT